MGLSAIVRNVVKVADTVTKDLQADISHYPFQSRNGYGVPTYGSATVRPVIISYKQTKRLRDDGVEVVSRMKVMIIANVAVGMHDKITFPDGSTAPILDIESMLDGDGNHYAVEIFF